METEASLLLSSVGFTWDQDGLKQVDLFVATMGNLFPIADPEIQERGIPSLIVVIRLWIIISSPDGTIDEPAVNAWIPTPRTLAEMERSSGWLRRLLTFDVTGFGARAFLRLNRDDDAYELAHLAVAPEQGTLKRTTLVTCHSILGQVAAESEDRWTKRTVTSHGP